MSIAVNHKEKGTEEEKKHMNEIGLEYTIFFANSIYQLLLLLQLQNIASEEVCLYLSKWHEEVLGVWIWCP